LKEQWATFFKWHSVLTLLVILTFGAHNPTFMRKIFPTKLHFECFPTILQHFLCLLHFPTFTNLQIVFTFNFIFLSLLVQWHVFFVNFFWILQSWYVLTVLQHFCLKVFISNLTNEHLCETFVCIFSWWWCSGCFLWGPWGR